MFFLFSLLLKSLLSFSYHLCVAQHHDHGIKTSLKFFIFFSCSFSHSSYVLICLVTVNNNRLIFLDNLVTYRTVVPGCFLIYINWAVSSLNWALSWPDLTDAGHVWSQGFSPYGCGNSADPHKPGGERESSCVPGLELMARPAAMQPLTPLPAPSCPITHFVPQIFSLPGATVSLKCPLLWCGAS